jgi:hypothetical protein
LSNLADRLSASPADLVYATVGHSDALLDAVRKRIAELDISYETVEAIAGLQGGYLAKIIGSPPMKRVQLWTAFLLIEALGLRVKLEEDPELTEKLRHRYVKRKLTKKVCAQAGRIIELPPDVRVSRARLGGLARARLSNLSDINRRANLTRWARRREFAANAAVAVATVDVVKDSLKSTGDLGPV